MFSSVLCYVTYLYNVFTNVFDYIFMFFRINVSGINMNVFGLFPVFLDVFKMFLFVFGILKTFIYMF